MLHRTDGVRLTRWHEGFSNAPHTLLRSQFFDFVVVGYNSDVLDGRHSAEELGGVPKQRPARDIENHLPRQTDRCRSGGDDEERLFDIWCHVVGSLNWDSSGETLPWARQVS